MNKGTRNTGNRDILNRRSYLSAIGTSALAAGALAVGSGSAAASEDYEVIEVGRGQNWVHSLGDGETLENVLIDITASGADAQIRASGSGWTIRNVGFRGQPSGRNVNRITASGAGTIERVYLGDGIASGVTRNGGIGVPTSHRGKMTIKNCYIAEWTDNGIYASERNVSGTVHVVDSYLRDNNVTSLRMNRNGSTIEGCVIENTGNVPVAGPGDGSYGSVMSRGIWTGYGNSNWEMDVIDTHISVNGSNTNGNAIAVISDHHGTWGDLTTINLIDSEVDGNIVGPYVNEENVGNNPDTTIPTGTPTSAEEAASGVSDDDSSGGSNPDDGDESDDEDTEDEEGNEHLLAFVTEPNARFARYEFVADGPVEFTEADYETPSGGTIRGGTFTAEDFVDERDGAWHAGGVTGGGQGDAFAVSGPVTELEIDQPDVMWVELDGERMSPEEVIEKTSGDSDDGEDDSDEAPDDENGSDEPPADLTSAIVVDGTDVDEPSSYTFSVTGSVAPSTYRDATIDDGDEIDGTTVTGTVDGNRDAYWFSGDITGFWVSGDATVDVEYDAR